MTIRAILFDADGVIQTTSDDFLDTLKKFLHDADDVDKFLKDIFAAEFPALTGDGDFVTGLHGVLEHWNVHAPVEKVLNAWTLIKPIDGIETLVMQLRYEGILCCVASNQQSYRADHMSHLLGYCDIFDREFYSFDLGVMKPSPRFFEQIIDGLGIAPSELLFIDDNVANVDAAINAGINAAVFRALDHPDPVASLSGVIDQHGVHL